ncbi:methionine ABC transporter ATP-binding protein [Rhodocista pekingensis]|uniref:Methionine ABC transporter ATP-binding protein n=1 Tax=Rhodocista pekingensis TaxID=201185 RepID=A0ABW2KS41_9PROT
MSQHAPIRIEGLRKEYRQGDRTVVALDDVSLDIPSGSIFGILGHSGAGKTTLIRCLNLLERPTAGRILLGDVDLAALDPAALRRQRRRIGMVFQQFHLLHARTAAANVAAPLEIAGVPAPERRRRVAELLDLVGLADRADAWPSQLSGGQKQRVGIARALAADPDMLLCDEPTSALDTETTGQILELLHNVNRRLGVTVVLITHELAVVKAVCDGAALLEAGRLRESGPLPALLADPASRLGQWLLPPVQEPVPAGELPPHARLVELTLADTLATGPVLGALARELGLDVTLLGGGIERIGGCRVGRLLLALSRAGGPPDLPAALSLLSAHKVRAVPR